VFPQPKVSLDNIEIADLRDRLSSVRFYEFNEPLTRRLIVERLPRCIAVGRFASREGIAWESRELNRATEFYPAALPFIQLGLNNCVA
jgi:hypothetical protein